MPVSNFVNSSIKSGVKRNRIWDQVTVLPDDFESIATHYVSSGTVASVTFSSIPQTYKHLQIRTFSRTSSNKNIRAYFNGDTSNTTAAFHILYGTGSSVAAEGYASGSNTAMLLAYEASGTATSSFGTSVIDILDYTNTNKYTTVKVLSGNDANGSGQVAIGSRLWINTNAITSIELLPPSDNFQQYSHFALYGIKG